MPGMFTDGSGLDSDGVHDASASAAAFFSWVLLNTTRKIPAASATTATTAAMVSQGSPWRRDTTGAGVRLFFVLLPLAMMRVRSLLFDAGSRVLLPITAAAQGGRWPTVQSTYRARRVGVSEPARTGADRRRIVRSPVDRCAARGPPPRRPSRHCARAGCSGR